MNLGKKIILGSLLLTTFFSCNDDESLEGVKLGKPTATLSSTSATIEEGETVSFTINLDYAISKPSKFKVSIINPENLWDHYDYTTSGTFTKNADADGPSHGAPGYIVTVPAYQTSGTFTITVDNNYELDTNGRDYEFSFIGVDTMLAKVAADSEKISIHVNEELSNTLSFQLDWSNAGLAYDGDKIEEYKALDDDGEERDYSYAKWDFDLYVLDSGFEPADGQVGATGDVPELSAIDLSTLADGDYYVVADLYQSGRLATGDYEFETFPMTFKATKHGVWSYENAVTDFSSTDFVDGASFQKYAFLARFTKSGDTVTLYNGDGTEQLASGRVAQ